LSCLLGALKDGDLACHEINMLPPKRSDFTTTQTAKDCEKDWDKKACASHSLDEFNRLRKVISLHRFSGDLRRPNAGARISSDDVPHHRLCKGLLEDPVDVEHAARGQSASAITATAGKSRYIGGRNLRRAQIL
jgi:hypothetical protein